jgi:hypothetical protein
VIRLGDRQRFAVEVAADWSPGQLRRVDLWAGEHELTRDDAMVFVPQFVLGVEWTLGWLRSACDLCLPTPDASPMENHQRPVDEQWERFGFPKWGPTTDAIHGYLFRVGVDVVFTFELWRDAPGEVKVATMPEAELIGVLEALLRVLEPPKTCPLDRPG